MQLSYHSSHSHYRTRPNNYRAGHLAMLTYTGKRPNRRLPIPLNLPKKNPPGNNYRDLHGCRVPPSPRRRVPPSLQIDLVTAPNEM
jgi:hypothetical protein